jgi:mono/diheme cytochrome c family protein
MDDVIPTARPRAGRARSLRRAGLASCLTLTMALAAVACGDDDGTSSGGESSGSAATAVERGEQLARSRGCAGCHGQDFGGGAGPDWIGLAGSEVTLTDGSSVVADRDYLVRAIANPSAELVEGYNLKMPANNLSDAEIDDIVAFIQSLADG